MRRGLQELLFGKGKFVTVHACQRASAMLHAARRRRRNAMIVMQAAAETADPSRSELDVCYVRANQFPSNILAAAIERTTKNGVQNKLFWFHRAVNYICTHRDASNLQTRVQEEVTERTSSRKLWIS